jgi:hypothetical protein
MTGGIGYFPSKLKKKYLETKCFSLVLLGLNQMVGHKMSLIVL